jgi:large subunit ribosomal protein L31
MAQSIKTKYIVDATARCSNCGSSYQLGMTQETLTVEICGNCHPFYTGQETLIDTAGRIEKFQERIAKVGTVQTNKKQKIKTRKFKQTLADLNFGKENQAQEVVE